ncbi:MAG: shikimate kinase [Psychrilyobacter sp.]|nr:shikimate kinase [Psychrilyobacter sp.]
MKQNLILIGFMGSGKSTVGRELARSLHMNFVDTDHYIENKENMKIKDLFTRRGEEKFRKLESKYVQEISQMTHTIISTGGGVANSDANMNALKKNGFVVYLDCAIDCLVERVSRRNTRPLLNGFIDQHARVVELLNSRVGNYRKHKNTSVFINSKTNLEDTVALIKKLYINFD